MDIQVASNFERALFEASGRDAGWTRDAMENFARDKRLALPDPILAELRSRYDARSSDDEDTLSTINAIAGTSGRIIDPHTAVAVNALRKFGFREEPMVVLSTAHPAKFADAVINATGAPPPMPEELRRVLDLPERLEVLPNNLALIRQFISSRLAG
jgi:threonine synthase